MNKVTHRESNNVNLAIVHYVFNMPVVRERLDHAAAIFDVKPEVASAVKIKLDADDLEMVYLSVISVLTIIIIIIIIIVIVIIIIIIIIIIIGPPAEPEGSYEFSFVRPSVRACVCP